MRILQSCRCGGMEEFAMGDSRIEYHKADDFEPEAGDIVLYDHVFCNAEYDRIGIVLLTFRDHLVSAEGNYAHTNTSAIVSRPRDWHIRGYISLPDGFRY